MKLNKLKMVTAAALLTLSAGAQAGIIDLFSTDQANLSDATTGDGGLSSSVIGGLDILGGERDLYVELLSRDAATPGATADLGVAGGALTFSVDAIASGKGVVQWDGLDGSDALAYNLGGIDLTDGGDLSAFSVETLFSDLGYEFVIGAYTDADNWTEITFSATAVNAPTTSEIAFSGFNNAFLCGAVNPVPGVKSIVCGDGGTSHAAPVDFTNLGALQFIIDPLGGAVAVDLTLDSIRTVPEPSVLGLMGAGLLAGGLVGRARRKKNKA